jgi:hypothetical protein
VVDDSVAFVGGLEVKELVPPDLGRSMTSRVARFGAVLREPGPASYVLLAADAALIVAAVAYVRRRFGAPA